MSAAAPRKLRKLKLRPMSLTDVPADKVQPLNLSQLPAVALTEERLLALASAFRNIRQSTTVRAERFITPATKFNSQTDFSFKGARTDGTDPSLLHALLGRTSVKGESSASFTASWLEESAMLLQAVVKHRHGRGMRLQEEIAVNLGVNVADVVQLEHLMAQDAAAANIPPIAAVVLFLFTADTARLQAALAPPKPSESRTASHAVETALNDLTEAERLVLRFKQQIEAAAAPLDASASHSSVNLQSAQPALSLGQAVMALNFRDVASVSVWAGCVSLLLATLSVLCRNAPAAALRTDSASSNGSAVTDKDSKNDAKSLWCAIKYDSGEAALEAFLKMATDLDALGGQPLVAGVGWPMRLANAKSLRQFCIRAARSDGQPEVLPTDTKINNLPFAERLSKLTSNRDRTKAVNVNIVISTDACAPLPPFSFRKAELEGTLDPFCSLKFVGFSAEDNRLSFVAIPTTGTAASPMLQNIFQSVLNDAVKSNVVSQAIYNRLTENFPRPHRCPRHPTLPFAMFCHDCDIVVCASCCKEKHAHHTLTPRATFAGTERQKLVVEQQQLVLRRVQRLRELQAAAISDEAAMHRLVDSALDGVLASLAEREAALHADVSVRAAAITEEIEAEVAACERNRAAVEEAWKDTHRFRKGWPQELRAVKIEEPATIHGSLALQLPTKAVLQMLSVLKWSNPSQYLTTYVYPPDTDEPVGDGAP